LATTIAASVGTAMSAATGGSRQGHLQYAANQGAWWLFYLTSTNTLSALYSTDFTSWTAPAGGPFTLQAAHNSEGRNFGFCGGNLGSTDVLHLQSDYLAASLRTTFHSRYTLGPTWTRTHAEASTNGTADSASGGNAMSGSVVLLDSSARPIVAGGFLNNGTASKYGNLTMSRATNTDAGTSWTAGFPAAGSQTYVTLNALSSYALASLGSGNLLAVSDNAPSSGAVFTNLEWSKYTGTWSTAATALAAAVTSTSSTNWGLVGVTTGDIHVVALANNSNTFVHRRYNGTSWATGQAVPNLTLAANSGIFLATDGTDLWALAIDSSKNVQYIKWTAATPAWGSWAQLDAGGASARSYITGFPAVVNNTIGVAWTQANGTNFDIVGATLALAGGAAIVSPSSSLMNL
jgi:hypothetical protein